MSIATISATLAGQGSLGGQPAAWRRSADRTLIVAPAGPAQRGRAAPLLPLRWPNHFPGARLDYTLDFTRVLDPAERVTGATITVADIGLVGTDTTGRTVTAWLAGGTDGIDAEITITLATSFGRSVPHLVRLFAQRPPGVA